MKSKRIFAFCSAVFLFLLYAASIVSAFIGSPLSQSILMASIVCSICLPAALYGYVTILRYLKERNQELFLPEDNTAEEEQEQTENAAV